MKQLGKVGKLGKLGKMVAGAKSWAGKLQLGKDGKKKGGLFKSLVKKSMMIKRMGKG